MKNILTSEVQIPDTTATEQVRGKNISLLLKLLNKNQHIIKYAIIGCFGATLDFCIYILLTRKFGINYQVANAISVSIAITNNFLLNYFLNFKVRGNFLKRLTKFYSVGLLGLLLNALLLFIFIHFFHTSESVTKLFVIIVVVGFQFILNTRFTFK